MKEYLEPVNGYVLVKPTDTKHKGVIVVNHSEQPTEGKVIKSSDGNIHKNSRVIFSQSYNSKIVQCEGEDFLLVKGSDIIARRCMG